MTIGLVAYALDRQPTGIGHYTRQLLLAFSNLGLSYHVLRSGSGFQVPNVHPLRFASLAPSLLTIGQLEIALFARRYKLDLVHDPTGLAPLAASHARRILTLHDVFPLSFPGYSTLFEELVYRFWLPCILPRLDAVITVSQNSRQDICRCFHMTAEKVTVIPEAASPHFQPLTENELKPILCNYGLQLPYILYVGSVEPRKNLLRLIEAWILLHKILPSYRLVIVGARNYWKSSPVANVVRQSGLLGQVIFTGYIPDEDLPAIYNGASLFCFPSLYEGFGLPVLEAMACGTPVVTSNSSSLPEVAGDGAILVDPNNVDEIAHAMQRILEDPELARDLRRRGLQRAAQFSWEKTAKETIAVYERVLRGD
jgi:glycosyltransferase involved in cell wall biosynthesis